MINSAAGKGALFTKIRENLPHTEGMLPVADGREAAVATLALMRDVAADLSPRTIINAFEQSFTQDAIPRSTFLWNKLGDATGLVMARGARTLAMIWDSAWAAGGGAQSGGRIDKALLREQYENPHFMRSVTVNEIEEEIRNPTPL
jgi:hypothetical protein